MKCKFEVFARSCVASYLHLAHCVCDVIIPCISRGTRLPALPTITFLLGLDCAGQLSFMSHLSCTFPWDLIRQWLEHNKSCESCVLTPELYGQLVAELLFYQLNLQIHHLRLNLRWWWLCFLSIPEVSYLNQRQHAFCLRSAVYLYLKWKIWLSGIILLCLTYFSDFLHANANQPGNTDFSTL